MRIALTLLSSLAVAALVDPSLATAASLWKPGLQQKTCATLEWRPNNAANPSSGSNLFVYNTDGSVAFLPGNGMQTPFVPDALSPPQAIMVAACSPNIKAPHGHTYWATPASPR